MLPNGEERAYLIREVELKTIHEPARKYPANKFSKAIKRFSKHLKRQRMVGSVVLRISEMKNGKPNMGITYAVISDTDGELYLTVPKHGAP